MKETREIYPINIAGLDRELELFEVAPGVRIAILNILGDTSLVLACAKQFSEKLNGVNYDVIVTAEAKSIPLVHALSVETEKPYIVLRKSYKPYMGDTLKSETVSITTGKPQILYLDEKDRQVLKGKRVILLDDVISTGSTQKAMAEVVGKADAVVAAELAILTEGDQEKWAHIVSLGHVPVWIN